MEVAKTLKLTLQNESSWWIHFEVGDVTVVKLLFTVKARHSAVKEYPLLLLLFVWGFLHICHASTSWQ